MSTLVLCTQLSPEKFTAQKCLATNITKLVHGGNRERKGEGGRERERETAY